VAIPITAGHVGVRNVFRTVRRTLRIPTLTALARKLALIRCDITYRVWKVFNREKNFADFYAWQVIRKLDAGHAHKTLGKRRIDRDTLLANPAQHDPASFAATGTEEFSELVLRGMQPGHKVIEYGCGSLRIGQHCIRLLADEHYVGMDITDRFYSDGKDMLDPSLIASKHPQFFVISNQSLSAVANWKADFIFAAAVTQHVPPFELDSFLDKLCSLKHKDARLVLFFVAADQETRLKGKSWTYTASELTAIVQRRLPYAALKVVPWCSHASQQA
jgi:hypothetical protein